MTRRPAPTRRRLAHLLACLALVLGLSGLVLRPSPARADDLDPVQLTITKVTPASAADTSGEVVVTGTARNVGAEALRGVQVYLWRSSDPIADLGTLDEVLASEPGNPVGARMYTQPHNYFNITTVGSTDSQVRAGKQTFEPDEQVNFTVRGALSGDDGLGFSGRRAAHLLGLQVKLQGQSGVFGRARTLFSTAPKASVPAVSLVQLASRPSLLAESVFIDDHLAGEVSASGRLTKLLDLAGTPGSTLVLDPALYDELTVMAAGYTVGSATTPNAAGQAAAKNFLARLQPLLATGRAYRTLYGSPDVALASAAGRPELLGAAASALGGEHPMAGLPLAVVVPDGLDDDLVDFLAPLRPSVVLTPNTLRTTAVQRASSATDGATTAGTLTVVRLAGAAFEGGPSPEPSTTPPQLVGRLQAEQLAAIGSGTTLVTLVDTPEQARLLAAPAPWRKLVGLPELVAAANNPVEASFGETTPADPSGWFGPVDAVQGDLTAWGELTGDQAQATQSSRTTLPRLVSTQWDGNQHQARGYARAIQGRFGNVLAGGRVSLSVTPTIVTSASEQQVPVTVTNRLDRPVSVKVAFTSENPQRVDIVDSEVHTIPAGGTETIRVQVNTRANGHVGVTAELQTESGRPIGPHRTVTVNATQAGRVGWIIILGSGAVLLALTAMRIKQVQGERRGAHPVADWGQPQ